VAELTEALDDALRAYYPNSEPRTPITERRGLLARMTQLEKHMRVPKGRSKAVAAAKEAGIPIRTWRDLKAGTHAPKPATVGKLASAYGAILGSPRRAAAVARRGTFRHIRVSAVVVFHPGGGAGGSGARYKNANNSGEHRARPEGYRHFNADLLTEADRAHIVQAWLADGPDAAAESLLGACAARYEPVAFEDDEVKVTLK
jgi:hypothetical protein